MTYGSLSELKVYLATVKSFKKQGLIAYSNIL